MTAILSPYWLKGCIFMNKDVIPNLSPWRHFFSQVRFHTVRTPELTVRDGSQEVDSGFCNTAQWVPTLRNTWSNGALGVVGMEYSMDTHYIIKSFPYWIPEVIYLTTLSFCVPLRKWEYYLNIYKLNQETPSHLSLIFLKYSISDDHTIDIMTSINY